MLKLAKKDIKLLLSKKSGVILMLLGAPLLFFLISDERHGNNVAIIYLLTCFTGIISFDYEKKEESQRIFLSLPIARRDIVYSKYIMIPIYVIFYIVFINLYSKALNLLNVSNNLTTSMNENVGVFVIISIILGISLPMYFSFSTNVARGISYFVIILTNNIWVSNFDTGNAFNGRLFTYYGGIWAVVLGAFILLVSMGTSIILYNELDL